MFQQRHYEIFADLVARTRQGAEGFTRGWRNQPEETPVPAGLAVNMVDTTLAALVTNLGLLFAADNPRFKRDRFEEGCR
jgi:hypothetical protein